MRKILLLFFLLIFLVSNALAFEIDDATIIFHENTFKNTVAKINQQLQGLKNDFLAYSHEDPAFQYGYRNARLQVYHNAYGPDFQLSIEAGTGQFPQSTPGGAKMLFNFAQWRLNKIQILYPSQISHIYSFSPENLNAIYKTVQAHNNYIHFVYDFVSKTAKIIDAKLPALESQVSSVISKSKEKSKIYSNFANANNFTDAVQNQNTDRKTTSKNIVVSRNFLVHALDNYLNSIKNANAQTEVINSFVLGLNHDLLISFIQKNFNQLAKNQ